MQITANDLIARKPIKKRLTDVWLLVCSGRSNKGIARVLGISENTVEVYLGQLYRELDLEHSEDNARVMAVLIAIRNKGKGK